MDNIVVGRCSISLITQLRRCIFKKNKNIFPHLKLEIALAIPASNDEKYNSNNSAGQGLIYHTSILLFFFMLNFSHRMTNMAYINHYYVVIIDNNRFKIIIKYYEVDITKNCYFNVPHCPFEFFFFI